MNVASGLELLMATWHREGLPVAMAKNVPLIQYPLQESSSHPVGCLILVLQINMEPKNHPIEKESRFPNLHVWVPFFFPDTLGIIQLFIEWIQIDPFGNPVSNQPV